MICYNCGAKYGDGKGTGLCSDKCRSKYPEFAAFLDNPYEGWDEDEGKRAARDRAIEANPDAETNEGCSPCTDCGAMPGWPHVNKCMWNELGD